MNTSNYASGTAHVHVVVGVTNADHQTVHVPVRVINAVDISARSLWREVAGAWRGRREYVVLEGGGRRIG